MTTPGYINSGAITTDVKTDTSNVNGKTAIVTGGASGIGEAYVRALVKAGAFVVIADLDEEVGHNLAKELSSSEIKFVKTDVTKWTDQLAMFKTAISSSPSGRIDIVIANAGISAADSIFANNLELDEPEEPRLNVIDVNLTGVLYTVKLALFYFRKQNAARKGGDLDQNLILQGSLAGYLDLRGAVQYSASKWGLRGIMRCLRRSELSHNIRVNYIAPWFIQTKIMSEAFVQYLQQRNVDFATVEDAAEAALKIISDTRVKGRSLAILPRSLNLQGYQDLDNDDYPDDTLLGRLQDMVLVNS
ncbi:hypothetical protein LTR05_002064 [Lithohypha guttulata]|uniref:Uncharacterized protein n=1 Tax=Lithohypha guttulata TaxID=1690604 RepID=A0AAN7T2W6_9EURO|nr:hypothetical protein LTR05_002064 [Lithohypha guttulata]